MVEHATKAQRLRSSFGSRWREVDGAGGGGEKGARPAEVALAEPSTCGAWRILP
jgi:hypothetical protein